MARKTILERLACKEIKPDDLAAEVIADPKLLNDIFRGILSDKAGVRLGCAKIARIASEKDPKNVYKKMDFFIELLDSDNNIIKWNAMDVIGNLAMVDTQGRFERIFNKYYEMLNDESMITAGHVIDNSWKIALAKPHLAQKITSQLLSINKTHHSRECRNILAGKAIVAFDNYFDEIEDKKAVISFVKRQRKNTRPAARKKAEKFLKKWT